MVMNKITFSYFCSMGVSNNLYHHSPHPVSVRRELDLSAIPRALGKMRHDLVVKMCFFSAFGELRNARVGVSPHFVDLAPAARERERAM